MSRVERRRPPPGATAAAIALAAICCALAGLVYAELEAPMIGLIAPARRNLAEPPAGSENAAIPDGFALRPFEAYAAVLARPVFSPSRQPPPEVVTAVAGSDDFVLAGIVSSAADRTALIRQGQPLKTLRLKEGQAIQGWTIRMIAVDRILLESAGATRELKLYERSRRGGG